MRLKKTDPAYCLILDMIVMEFVLVILTEMGCVICLKSLAAWTMKPAITTPTATDEMILIHRTIRF